MKIRILSILAVICLLCGLALPALAESSPLSVRWLPVNVTDIEYSWQAEGKTYFLASSGDGYGILDEEFGTVLPLEYGGNILSPIPFFSEGLAGISKEWKKFGFVDITGQITIPLEYDNAFPFSKGLARVRKNGKFGYINAADQIVIPLEYDDAALSFSEGLAWVQKDEK